MIKYKCLECGTVTTEDKISGLIVIYNPLHADLEGIVVCPHCRAIDNFTQACDVSWCDDKTCAGVPSPYGYLMLCSDHYNELKAS